jgi:Protein of unknown function (DUF551)
MNWKPIETAPKDSSWVLLKGGEVDYHYDHNAKKPPCVVGQYLTRWEFASYDGGCYGEYENPTHWMELPKP